MQGMLTALGKAALEGDPTFKGVVDAITLAVAKITDEAYGGADTEETHSGRGCETPEMREYLANRNSKEASHAPLLRDAQLPTSGRVQAGTAGVGEES